MTIFLTAASILIALAALIAQFYFKWVPEIEDQKRHIKKAGTWAWYIFTVGLPLVDLFLLSKRTAPVTAGFVIQVALLACSISLIVALLVIRVLLGADGSPGSLGGLASIVKHIIDALGLLADDPHLAPETTTVLREMLYGKSATRQTERR